MHFTIILCTRNRASLLGEALASIAAILYAPEAFELLVVDNGSTDQTADVVAELAKRVAFAVRRVWEPRVGLSIARNTGIREARGRLLFFTDDDHLVSPGILEEYQKVASAQDAQVMQGSVELEFRGGRPAWLSDDLEGWFGRLVLQEGLSTVELHGGNATFHRHVFEQLGGFQEELGKGRAGYGEDTALSRRLSTAGIPIWAAPGAVIHHLIEDQRLEPTTFRAMVWNKGLCHGQVEAAGAPVLRAARDAARDVVTHSVRGTVAALRRDEAKRLSSSMQVTHRLACLFGQGKSLWARRHKMPRTPAPLRPWCPPVALPMTTIVVVSSGPLGATERCLAGIYRHTHVPFEVIVVPGAASEDSLRHLHALSHDDLRVLAQDEPLCVGAAFNTGAAAARGEFLALLRDDTLVCEGWLEPLLRGLVAHPQLAVIGPMTNVAPNGQRLDEDLSTASADRDQVAATLGLRASGCIAPERNLLGFCRVMRQQLFEELGRCDEALGDHQMDDLCLRAERAGWLCAAARDAYVHQLGGAQAWLGRWTVAESPIPRPDSPMVTICMVSFNRLEFTQQAI
ncbi:MAG: glycosyltransferase family 2 protein, partial [Deltaproteobacteria bacterium]|nr:glycosyltransferase family 2 protein [Deltaproteobacteria bacterium]